MVSRWTQGKLDFKLIVKISFHFIYRLRAHIYVMTFEEVEEDET